MRRVSEARVLDGSDVAVSGWAKPRKGTPAPIEASLDERAALIVSEAALRDSRMARSVWKHVAELSSRQIGTRVRKSRHSQGAPG